MRVHMHANVCVCACVRVWVHVYVCVYACMYFCVYVCMCVYVRALVDVHMHLCRPILFICTVQSLYYMRVYQRRGSLCFGRGRDRGFVLYISLFLRVFGWGVCVCLYTRVHTHKLLEYLK